MLTYYFRDPEDALKQAKADSKHPGCYFGGITLPSGKRAFAVYERRPELRRVNGSNELGIISHQIIRSKNHPNTTHSFRHKEARPHL